MNIHDKIKSIRKTQQWTQEEMAEKLGITPSSYAKIERGTTKLNIDKLQQIAEIFNIEMTELLTSDKSLVFLVNENGDYNANYYSCNDAILAELEKSKTIVQFQEKLLSSKDRLLEQKDNEITALKEIINLMKK
jgi:helix-turn-helix domain-containing protein